MKGLHYGTILERYSRFSRLYGGFFPRFHIGGLAEAFGEVQFKAFFEKEHRRRKSKVKFDLYKLIKRWPEFTDSIRPIVLKRFEARYLAKVKQLHLLENLLWELSKTYTEPLTADWVELKRSDTGTYRSQGYGMYTYARNALTTAELVLDIAGVPHMVEREDQVYEGKPYGAIYILYGKCSPELLDALSRRTHIERDKLSGEFRKRGVNPLVYYPFDKVEDWSPL
jgi:hypothetical protein